MTCLGYSRNNFFHFQVARESYLQWLADQEKSRGKSGSGRHPPPAATVTSGQMSPRAAATCSSVSGQVSSSSPRGSSSPRPRGGHAASNSPKAGCSYHQSDQASGGRDSPIPGSSRSLQSSSKPQSSHSQDHGLGPGFHLRETASYLNGLPPDLFGKYIFCPGFSKNCFFKIYSKCPM